MLVTIERRTARNVASGQTVTLPQFRVRVDGRHAGYIQDKPGASVQLTQRWAPEDIAEIQRQVAALREQSEIGINQPPEISDALRAKVKEVSDETASDEDF